MSAIGYVPVIPLPAVHNIFIKRLKNLRLEYIVQGPEFGVNLAWSKYGLSWCVKW